MRFTYGAVVSCESVMVNTTMILPKKTSPLFIKPAVGISSIVPVNAGALRVVDTLSLT